MAIELEPAGGDGLWPPVEPGAHIDFHLPNGLVRQYSLCNEAGRRDRYVVAVQREAAGRGGSAWIHDNLGEGDVLTIGTPRNNFPLLPADRHFFIAGGIGITPIRAMVRALAESGGDYELYYCTRAAERTAFHGELAAPPHHGHTTFVHDGGDPSQGLDLTKAIEPYTSGARLYCCGPAPLMQAVGAEAARKGWPEDRVHFEHFKAEAAALDDTGDTAFEVVLGRSGKALPVPPERSLLEVLEDAGCDVDSLCREGICGTCETRVLEGLPDHRDHVLSAGEKASGKAIMPCVSRARSARLVLDL